MPKLKFKRSPEEEAKHQERKARRKEKKRQRTASENPHESRSSKRSHRATDDDVTTRRRWASSDEEDIPATEPASTSRAFKADDTWYSKRHSKRRNDVDIRAEMEEQAFRERLFDAMGHDERLDGLENELNDFAHVPDRWKTAATGTTEKELYDEDDFLKLNPSTLDDDEYAEWVRLGMYRKSHAAEHAEHLRRKAAAAERRAAEKAQRAEARRLEKLAEDERRMKKRAREKAKNGRVKDDYHAQWKVLLDEANNSANPTGTGRELEFAEIPWPIYNTSAGLAEEEFTKDAIAAFLLAGLDDKKQRKDVLREAFLRYHPDKFEGRFMRRVKEEDKERVREAIQQISRVLNHLLEDV